MIHRGQIGGRKREFAACPVPDVGSGSPGPGVRQRPDAHGRSIPVLRRAEPPGKETKRRRPRAGGFSPAFLQSPASKLPVSGGSGSPRGWASRGCRPLGAARWRGVRLSPPWGPAGRRWAGGAPLRNGAWERGGGAWGLPACGLAGGGGGERPPNSAGKEGAAPSSHPVGMRPGQPDPRSPGLSPRLRRGLGAASCAGLSPAGGCGGRNPLGAPRRGRARPSGAAGKAAPDPLPPPGVRGPRHLAGCGAACTSLLACV